MKHTVQEIKLKNGAKGLLVDVPDATTMSMQFQFRAGSRYAKSKDIEQVAHIMEHMAFGANARFKSENEFDYEFTKNGAYLNAMTSDFSMIYEADCADFEWERILDLQLVAICQPRFEDVKLTAEKGNVKNELTNYLNDYQRVLYTRVQQLLGEDVLTYRQAIPTIANVTLSDVKEHHKRTHTTTNMRFIIAGKMKGRAKAIRDLLENVKLEAGERFEVAHDELIKSAPTIIRRKDSTNLTFGLFMTVDRDLSDEELDAMYYLNHILTGTMYSRIFGSARKKGIAYNVESYTASGPKNTASCWDIVGQVNHESAEDLFEIIASELKNVLDGKIKQSEVDTAKSFALGRYQMGAQTVSQIRSFYAGRYFDDDYIKNYDKIPDMIRKVTLQRMVDTARSFIQEDKWVLAAVSSGDRQEILNLSTKIEPIFERYR